MVFIDWLGYFDHMGIEPDIEHVKKLDPNDF